MPILIALNSCSHSQWLEDGLEGGTSQIDLKKLPCCPCTQRWCYACYAVILAFLTVLGMVHSGFNFLKQIAIKQQAWGYCTDFACCQVVPGKRIESSSLCRALYEIFMGEDPVIPDGKKTWAAGARLLLASQEDL